jgi:hypothetical protein
MNLDAVPLVEGGRVIATQVGAELVFTGVVVPA